MTRVMTATGGGTPRVQPKSRPAFASPGASSRHSHSSVGTVVPTCPSIPWCLCPSRTKKPKGRRRRWPMSTLFSVPQCEPSGDAPRLLASSFFVDAEPAVSAETSTLSCSRDLGSFALSSSPLTAESSEGGRSLKTEACCCCCCCCCCHSGGGGGGGGGTPGT